MVYIYVYDFFLFFRFLGILVWVGGEFFFFFLMCFVMYILSGRLKVSIFWWCIVLLDFVIFLIF